jgi:hypothetical protein
MQRRAPASGTQRRARRPAAPSSVVPPQPEGRAQFTGSEGRSGPAPRATMTRVLNTWRRERE